ncbi:MAG: hypothetical protein AAGB26_08600 [Planctomycetota bacterium]
MSVQTQPFRVVGVNTETGEDVSVVIEAATKAAAEVKAEQMQIETTHIVRIKQEAPEPPDEHELFSAEAAEALAGKRTDKLIEEVVPPEEPRPVAQPTAPTPTPADAPTPNIVNAITRPTYAAPANQREPIGSEISGLRVFSIVLLLLLGMSAGAYYVLIHQPNAIQAQDENLVFGQDLFSDVLEPASLEQTDDAMRDVFNARGGSSEGPSDDPPIAVEQQLRITPPPTLPTENDKPVLQLQSVVTTNNGRFAVINGKLYEQGGAIGSATLVSVADDWVLIERDGKQFTLRIEAAKPQ